MRPLTPPTQTLGPTSLGSTLPRSQRTSTVGSLILSLSPSLLASQVPLLLDAIRIWRRFCVENGIFESAGGAVTCGSLHMGEIRVGNKRANQRHHICNETFLIWGATTKFRMGRVDGHNPHIRKDLPLTWTNVYEEATNSSVSLSMLAPYARIGKPSISSGFLGRIHKAYAALPSSVFEVESPGNRFSGIMYGADGFGCGIIGQGIANLILTAKWYGFLSREHKDIRRRHTCATTCEECCSLWYDLGKTKKVSVWGALKHCTGMAFFCIGW
ncbi:Protein RETICULATA, chloroplastic isoform C [Glycine soja]|uniref:Protein RETICULATA, chloroplastic isoform C n=1 Tax=Glycine soja TaxID=3848 RepID=A0A445IME9_GLYSO|nr:Protein RETICULATA, chloroplastic isoform C [Glycine soja]